MMRYVFCSHVYLGTKLRFSLAKFIDVGQERAAVVLWTEKQEEGQKGACYTTTRDSLSETCFQRFAFRDLLSEIFAHIYAKSSWALIEKSNAGAAEQRSSSEQM